MIIVSLRLNMHILILTFFIAFAHGKSVPTVCINNNETCYVGAWLDSRNSQPFASFQGIKYAMPPTGDLRFKPPQRYLPGKKTFMVDEKWAVNCPQQYRDMYTEDDDFIIAGIEDCLYLNVYVPEIALINGIKLPVMVWIHGGSLITGSGIYDEYGPLHFMDKEVILVTINYRLGPLGFLFMADGTVSGNAGLKDQVMALQWVQDNIAGFGGDPGTVTIFGESAGSFSVALHLLSPLSENLFQRAILQSGATMNPGWDIITPEQGIKCANLLRELVHCDQEFSLTCLQEKTMEEIILHTYNVSGTCWMAVPDLEYGSEPFLIGDPEDLMSSGQFNTNVEIIIGTNVDEGILAFLQQIVNSTAWNAYRNNFDIVGPMELFEIATEEEVTELDIKRAHELIEFYVGSIENIDEQHQQEMFDMMTDSIFLYGTHRTIRHFLKHNVTTFSYTLTYQGNYSFTNYFGIETIGVCHGDDIVYLFEPCISTIPGHPILDENDSAVRNTMVTAWTNFAKTGNPGMSWEPQSARSASQFWNISGPEPKMDTSSYIEERMLLWEQVLDRIEIVNISSTTLSTTTKISTTTASTTATYTTSSSANQLMIAVQTLIAIFVFTYKLL